MALPMAGVVGTAEYTECTGVGPRARSPTGKNGMPACAELMMRCRAFELSRPGVAARSITESGHQGKIRGAGSREFRLNERRIRRDDAFLGGRKYIFCIRGGEMVPGNLRAGTFSLPLSVRRESTRAPGAARARPRLGSTAPNFSHLEVTSGAEAGSCHCGWPSSPSNLLLEVVASSGTPLGPSADDGGPPLRLRWLK
jgi:hypothetical protein